MAPLSKELAGIILPYDHYGTHLDNQGRTIDMDKEKENFTHAGESLAEIWSNLVIDKHPVVSNFVKPEESELEESAITRKSMEWHSKHVRSSQYLLQIVKCKDEDCWPLPRSSLLKILPQRFLPPPVPISQSDDGLNLTDGNGQFPTLFIATTMQYVLCILKYSANGPIFRTMWHVHRLRVSYCQGKLAKNVVFITPR